MIISNLPFVKNGNKVVTSAYIAQAYFDKFPLDYDNAKLMINSYDNLEVISYRLQHGLLDFEYALEVVMGDEEVKEYLYLGTGTEIKANFPTTLKEADDDELYVIKVKLA